VLIALIIASIFHGKFCQISWCNFAALLTPNTVYRCVVSALAE